MILYQCNYVYNGKFKLATFFLLTSNICPYIPDATEVSLRAAFCTTSSGTLYISIKDILVCLTTCSVIHGSSYFFKSLLNHKQMLLD